MPTRVLGNRVVADVKCYFCGHISGQIVGVRNQPLTVANFVPREGYSGPEVKPGTRLRCERCQGPVFLETASSITRLPQSEARINRRKSSAKRAHAA